MAALTSDPAISSPFTKQDAHLEVGDEGSPGLPLGDEPLSRDSFLRMQTGAEAEGRLIPRSSPLICPYHPSHTPRDSRTETLGEADSSPHTWGAGAGGSWRLNNTGDTVAEGSRCRWEGWVGRQELESVGSWVWGIVGNSQVWGIKYQGSKWGHTSLGS